MNDTLKPTCRRLALAAACCVVAAGLAVPTLVPATATAQQAAARDAAETYNGITRPSEEFELSLPNLGRIDEVMVETGDTVDEGQVLLKQSAEIEQARLEELAAEADVAGRVETARKRAELAKVQEERQKQLLDSGGGGQLEYEEARLNRIVADAQIAEEERQGTAAEARVKQLQVTLKEKALSSPRKGVVRSIEAQVGEMHGPQEPVVGLVVVDPLTVEVLGMPPSVVSKLQRGQELDVRYGGGNQWTKAKVTFIDPIVNSAVNEQAIELELPNPDALPAGLEVEVRASPAAGADNVAVGG